MQTDKEQLARQQEIMKARGYYQGEIDGVWGPASIQAKQTWESDVRNFIPARPSHGLPFDDTQPLPRGMEVERRTRLLVCPVLEANKLSAASKPKQGKPEQKEKQDTAE